MVSGGVYKVTESGVQFQHQPNNNSSSNNNNAEEEKYEDGGDNNSSGGTPKEFLDRFRYVFVVLDN